MVERGNVALGNAEEFRVGQVLVLVMAGRAEVGRIDLQDETGAVDGLVFLCQRVGERFDIGVFVLVEAVGHEFCQYAGRGGVHERLDRTRNRTGCRQVPQVGFERSAVAIGHRPDAARYHRRIEPLRAGT